MISNRLTIAALALPPLRHRLQPEPNHTARTRNHRHRDNTRTPRDSPRRTPLPACIKLPELSPKIPALPAGLPCAKPLYTITTVPAVKLENVSPLEAPASARPSASSPPASPSPTSTQRSAPARSPRRTSATPSTTPATSPTAPSSTPPSTTGRAHHHPLRQAPGHPRLGHRLRRHARRRQAPPLHPLPARLRRQRASPPHPRPTPNSSSTSNSSARATPRPHPRRRRPSQPHPPNPPRPAKPATDPTNPPQSPPSPTQLPKSSEPESNIAPLTASIPHGAPTMFEKIRPLFPYLKRYWKNLAWGGVAVILYNVIRVLLPLIVGHAIDDMSTASPSKDHLPRPPPPARRCALRDLPLHHPPGPHRRLPRDRVRSPQRPLRQPRTPVPRLLPHPSHRRHHGPHHQRPQRRPPAPRPGHHVLRQLPRLHRRRAALHDPHQPEAHLLRRRPAPAASVLVQGFGSRIHRRFERIQAMFSDISAKAQENFSGARLIRAFAQEDAEIASFETANQEYIRRSLHLVRLMAMLWPSLELVLGLALMITLLVGGHGSSRTASPSATSPPSTSTWSSSSSP